MYQTTRVFIIIYLLLLLQVIIDFGAVISHKFS